MFQVIPKWQVDVTLESGKCVSVWMSDNFAGNVLRVVAGMSFSANPLDGIEKITVTLVSAPAVGAVDPVIGVTAGGPRA